MITFPAAQRERPFYTTCWQRHVCKQLAQGCYLPTEWPRVEPQPSRCDFNALINTLWQSDGSLA